MTLYWACTFDSIRFNTTGGGVQVMGQASMGAIASSAVKTCAGGADIIAFSYTQETASGFAYGASYSGLHSIGPFLCSDGTCLPGVLVGTAGGCGAFGSTGGYSVPSPPC